MKKLLTLFSLLFMGWIISHASETSITFSEKGYTNQQSLDNEKISLNNEISIKFNKNTGNTAPAYYTTGNAARLYGGNTLTFTGESGIIIEKIVFTCPTGNYGWSENITAGSGSVSTTTKTAPTWTGSANTVTFTNNNGNGHCRISKIVVTYSGGSGVEVAAPTFDPAGGIVNSGTSVTIAAAAGLEVYYVSKTDLGSYPVNADNVFAHGTKYNAPFTVNASETYYAVALDDDENFSAVATATYTVLDLEHAGTEADPLTVAEAIQVANAYGTSSQSEPYCVTGYVCSKPVFYKNFGSFNFYISADGLSTSPQFQIFKMVKYADGTPFTEDDPNAIEEGDLVVACGPMKLYNTTPETNGAYLVSVTKTTKEEAGIAWSDEAYTWKIGQSTAADLPTLSNPNSLAVTYTSSKESVATISEAGVVTIVGEGETTITAEFAGDTQYLPSTVSYTLTVVDPSSITDLINADNIPDFTNNYTNYTYTNNGVTYIIYGYKNAGIQFNANSKAHSGIVTTANINNYAVKSLVVDVKTINNVPLLVIGRNTPYTGTEDIYNASDRTTDLGTVIKEISATGETTITPTDQYKYICICPKTTAKSGVIVLNSVKVSWKEYVVEPVELTVSDVKYSTLYYSDRALVVPTGLAAYTFAYNAAKNEVTAAATYAAGDVIPAGVAVVLYGNAGDYTFALADEAGTAPDENILKGTDETKEETAEGTPYVLSVYDNTVGFYWAAADGGQTFTNKAHKAYLDLPTSANGAPAKIILDFGNTDGINCIVVDQNEAEVSMYNVLGQPVNNNYRGFVIRNGKKAINK